MVKIKQSGKVDFGGELRGFKNFKFTRHLQPTPNFLEIFFVSIGGVKNSTCTRQVFIDFH